MNAPKTEDPFDLERFLEAQEEKFDTARSELRRGSKSSHWMWFIFPQVQGLGRSSTAEFYAIKSRGEADAYLAHPVLGSRLLQCAEALLQVHGKSAREIMGFPDDLKLRSSATLFSALSGPGSLFERLLERYFDGQPDEKTLAILSSWK
jgi:uncharacterized protein (DUF1810 family)